MLDLLSWAAWGILLAVAVWAFFEKGADDQ